MKAGLTNKTQNGDELRMLKRSIVIQWSINHYIQKFFEISNHNIIVMIINANYINKNM